LTNTVFAREEIELISGRTLNLRPMNIKTIRKFQVALKNYNKVLHEAMENKDNDSEPDFTDNFVEMVSICLQGIDDDLAGDTEKIEDELDLDTIFYILDKVAGMNFSDPNLQAAAALAQMKD
jgi:hypothetical protein